MKLRSLRLRIALLSALLSGTLLATFGATAWLTLRQANLARLDSELRSQLFQALVAPPSDENWAGYTTPLTDQLGQGNTENALLWVQGEGETLVYQSPHWPSALDPTGLDWPLALSLAPDGADSASFQAMGLWGSGVDLARGGPGGGGPGGGGGGPGGGGGNGGGGNGGGGGGNGGGGGGNGGGGGGNGGGGGGNGGGGGGNGGGGGGGNGGGGGGNGGGGGGNSGGGPGGGGGGGGNGGPGGSGSGGSGGPGGSGGSGNGGPGAGGGNGGPGGPNGSSGNAPSGNSGPSGPNGNGGNGPGNGGPSGPDGSASDGGPSNRGPDSNSPNRSPGASSNRPGQTERDRPSSGAADGAPNGNNPIGAEVTGLPAAPAPNRSPLPSTVTGPSVTGPSVTGPSVTGPSVTGPTVTGPTVTGPAVSRPVAPVMPDTPGSPPAAPTPPAANSTPAPTAEAGSTPVAPPAASPAFDPPTASPVPNRAVTAPVSPAPDPPVPVAPSPAPRPVASPPLASSTLVAAPAPPAAPEGTDPPPAESADSADPARAPESASDAVPASLASESVPAAPSPRSTQASTARRLSPRQWVQTALPRLIGLPTAAKSPQPPPDEQARYQFQTIALDGQRWRLGFVADDDLQLVMGVNLSSTEAQLLPLRNAMVVSLPLGLLLIAGSSWMLSSRALLSIRQLTTTVQGVTAQGLDQRLSATDHDTELQPLMVVFNQMLERLDRSFHQAKRFSSDAAHELKTPITILQGEIERSLLQAEDGSAQQQTFGALLEETQRLKSIVRKLLLLSQADAGSMPLHRTLFPFSQAMADVADDGAMLAPDLTITLDGATDAEVNADATLTRQVFQNLMGNAIKYNRPHGHINLTVEDHPDRVALHIKNTASPLSIEDQGQLFERFYRGKTQASTTDGLGLGLSLCREIARAHGGEVTLVGVVGGEVCFQFWLPKDVAIAAAGSA